MMWYQSIWVTEFLLLLVAFLAFYLIWGALSLSLKNRVISSVIAGLLIICLVSLPITIEVIYRNRQKKFRRIVFEIASIKDLSDFEADKYSVNVIVPRKATKQQLRVVIMKANNLIRKQKEDASLIRLALFNQKLPDKELVVTDTNPNFIAQTQWSRPGYYGFLKRAFKSDEKLSDIDIYWKKQ